MTSKSIWAAFLALATICLFNDPVHGQSGPPDKPVSAEAEKVRKLEKAIEPYVKKARATLPEAKKKFLKGLPNGDLLFVTIKLRAPGGQQYEQVFVKVVSWQGPLIQGSLASDVTLVPDHKRGEKMTCQEGDILDWTIARRDGSEEGNFVGKFLDTYQP